MAEPKQQFLKENNSALNREALFWLKEANGPAPDHYLHLLSLADWGLEIGLQTGWKNRWALREQVNGLFGWKVANVMKWLLAHPDGLPRQEQEAHLLDLLQTSDNPECAAHHVLETIYDKQLSQNPALRP